MFKLLRSLFPASASAEASGASKTTAPQPPLYVSAPGVDDFPVASQLVGSSDFPLLNWEAAHLWVDSIPDPAGRPAAWDQLERAWLEHLWSALGPAYTLRATDSSMLLSTLDAKIARATIEFMEKTVQRVVRVLDGIAEQATWGKDILIVFDTEEQYYQYVSHYYASGGEFAASGGMYINAGCGHFVTVRSDLRSIEPVIAHEITHSCVAHLPIPAWLNEGLAVNTEHRLCASASSLFTPQQMHAKHLAFWGDSEIQEFWSGKSFLRNDDGNMLSYDLARILVAQLSSDWDSFRAFALNANGADAGAAAAAECLQIDLGVAVCALLEREPDSAWSPNPASWHEAPERGAF